MNNSRRPATEPRLRSSTPLYFRYTIRLLRHFPNFDFPFILSLRRKAVECLQLPSGGRALDMGCGTGGSFPYLVGAVGQTGEVVGVEISPEVANTARKRIAANHWVNAHVVVADARSVVLSGKFDGVLMFGAPDIYASQDALLNLLPYLNDGARLVAFGMKLTNRRFGRFLNLLSTSLMRLSFASTPGLSFEPWSPLQAYSTEITVNEYVCGCFFLASCSIRSRCIGENHGTEGRSV